MILIGFVLSIKGFWIKKTLLKNPNKVLFELLKNDIYNKCNTV